VVKFSFTELYSIQSALRDSQVILDLLRKERINRGFTDTPTVERIGNDIAAAKEKISEVMDKLNQADFINLGS